ncbi:MAG: hypothetical protein K0R63_643 [Rickettsiales bacterium]|jgi:hypothetical protein|nr:hypothetical protein [Rickettsiales bacterium]
MPTDAKTSAGGSQRLFYREGERERRGELV